MSEERAKRKLTGILSADAVGYSRLMREDEAYTVQTLEDSKKLMADRIDQFRGRVVDAPGDNLLAEFSSVVDAIECAVEIQKKLKVKNAEIPENRKMEFRIGVNLGDVIEEDERIYGDGVNVAARIEGLAAPGEINISRTAYDQIRHKLKLGYEYLGEHTVKNLAEPVRVYRVLTAPEAAGKVIGEKRFLGKISRRTATVAIIALVIVAVGLIGWNIYLHQSKKVEPASLDKMSYPLPDKPSIAVLPFDNLSGDPNQEYFSDGLTEEIITGLSMVPELFVIARNSTFTYKGKPVKVQQVSEELGVQYVLEGSVRKTEDQVRITAQLIDALSGHHIWAERYNRTLADIFAIQDEITMKILTALQVKLTIGEEARLHAKGTDNLEAYLKVMQGRDQFYHFNKKTNARAKQLFEEAIALDPKYAMAYRFLGSVHLLDVWIQATESPRESLSKAFEMARKAIALDDSLADAHALLGSLYTYKRQHNMAIEKGEQAVALDPNSADAHQYLAVSLFFAGRHEESIAYSKRAIRFNPIPPVKYYLFLGHALCHAGRHEEAIEAINKVLRGAPNNLFAHTRLISCYSLLGRDEEARAEAAEVLRINPKFSLKRLAKTLPFKNKADSELIINALSKAGLK